MLRLNRNTWPNIIADECLPQDTDDVERPSQTDRCGHVEPVCQRKASDYPRSVLLTHPPCAKISANVRSSDSSLLAMVKLIGHYRFLRTKESESTRSRYEI